MQVPTFYSLFAVDDATLISLHNIVHIYNFRRVVKQNWKKLMSVAQFGLLLL